MRPKYYEELGGFLKRARLNVRTSDNRRLTQLEVASRLEHQGISASQGLIAQYEAGRIKDPDPHVLQVLAELYGEPYERIAFHLYCDKYDPGDWREGIRAGELALLQAARCLHDRDVGDL